MCTSRDDKPSPPSRSDSLLKAEQEGHSGEPLPPARSYTRVCSSLCATGGQSGSGGKNTTAGTFPSLGDPPFSLVNPAVIPKVESLWPFKASLEHTGE